MSAPPANFSHQRATRIYLEVLHWLEVKQLLRSTRATALHLSELMGCDHRAIGTAVRIKTGENYNALLSRLRVEAVCRLMADPAYDASTLEELMILGGFNTRQSFYNAFRRHRGCTPKACRLAIRQARADSSAAQP